MSHKFESLAIGGEKKTKTAPTHSHAHKPRNRKTSKWSKLVKLEWSKIDCGRTWKKKNLAVQWYQNHGGYIFTQFELGADVSAKHLEGGVARMKWEVGLEGYGSLQGERTTGKERRTDPDTTRFA